MTETNTKTEIEIAISLLHSLTRGDNITLIKENKTRFGQVCIVTKSMILINTVALDTFFQLVECEFDEENGYWRATCEFRVNKLDSFPTEEQYQPLLKINLPRDIHYSNWQLVLPFSK